MFRKILVLTLLLTLLLAGCGPARSATATELPVPVSTKLPATETVATVPPASGEITLTDGLGRSVVLKEPAQRIVSLAYWHSGQFLDTYSQLIHEDTGVKVYELAEFPLVR
jgi:ABC-type Fe3+-hydroxamate transport system substrate-binding protein